MARKNDYRKERKAATRQRLIDAAQALFRTENYHDLGIRELAGAADLSTGALYNNFPDGKEQLFTEAMGFPPPVDGPLTRAAPMLLEALTDLRNQLVAAWPQTESLGVPIPGKLAIDLATSPLDGEVWTRHLESIRRDVPHDCRAEQPAALDPSDAAGDL